MRDLLPEAAAAEAWVIETHGRVAGLFGYLPIAPPIVEYAELFERGVGTGTDIVEKEMYAFDDRGGRRLALRPEGTAGVLRAARTGGLCDDGSAARLFYSGPMFRYDRPQAGRYRQFSQVGAEYLGETSPHADAEIIELGFQVIRAIGIEDAHVELNSLGSAAERQDYRNRLREFYAAHVNELCADCQRRLDDNPLRLLDCKKDAELASHAPLLSSAWSSESRDYFEAVCSSLSDANISFRHNERLVRGLDYYAHTAFEYWHSSLGGAQNALGGGGRYDGLAEVLGLPPTGGVGYALGVERLLMVTADTHGAPGGRGAEVVVCSVSTAEGSAALALARRIRSAGIAVEADASRRKLDGKLRSAHRHQARIAVIVGESEVATTTAVVRNLGTREQRTVPWDELGATIAHELHQEKSL